MTLTIACNLCALLEPRTVTLTLACILCALAAVWAITQQPPWSPA